MSTIILNTLTGAVSEHALPVTGVSAAFACSESGLYAIGGSTDDRAAIDARAVLPITDLGSSQRKRMVNAYFGVQGPRGSSGNLIVQTVAESDQGSEMIEEFAYPFDLRDGNLSRGVAGRGIRANRLGIGYANANGADFRLKGIEADILESKSRRIG